MQYNTINVKLSNSKLSKLKSEIKNGSEVSLYLSSNVIGNSNDENDFANKFSLTDAQVLWLRKAFSSGLSAIIKLLKTLLPKMVQSGGSF